MYLLRVCVQAVYVYQLCICVCISRINTSSMYMSCIYVQLCIFVPVLTMLISTMYYDYYLMFPPIVTMTTSLDNHPWQPAILDNNNFYWLQSIMPSCTLYTSHYPYESMFHFDLQVFLYTHWIYKPLLIMCHSYIHYYYILFVWLLIQLFYIFNKNSLLF